MEQTKQISILISFSFCSNLYLIWIYNFLYIYMYFCLNELLSFIHSSSSISFSPSPLGLHLSCSQRLFSQGEADPPQARFSVFLCSDKFLPATYSERPHCDSTSHWFNRSSKGKGGERETGAAVPPWTVQPLVSKLFPPVLGCLSVKSPGRAQRRWWCLHCPRFRLTVALEDLTLYLV